MKPIQVVELEPIFAHERTELYRRTRELHAFAARLENDAGSTRYFGALTQTGLLAMLSTASAGVAVTDRVRARHLASLRDRLARFACALRSMADRGLLDDDVLRLGNSLVKHAEDLVPDFDIELRCVEADLLVDRRDAERSRNGIAAANDELPVDDPPAQTVSEPSVTTAPMVVPERSNTFHDHAVADAAPKSTKAVGSKQSRRRNSRKRRQG